MSFFTLRECDVISTVYTAHPSYTFILNVNSGFVSEPVYVFNSTSVGVDRTFSDLDGNPVTGSYNLSGVVSFVLSSQLSTREKQSLYQLRNIYASSSFVKIDNYTSSSLFNGALPPANQTVHILNVPQVLYGSEIKPGSFNLDLYGDWDATDVFANIHDDAFGGLFSASVLMGCIFYQHGIAFLGPNFGEIFGSISNLVNVTASFSGTHEVPTNLYLCRIPRGELNFSRNNSYTSLMTGSNTQETTTTQPKTLVTGVALYDDEYKLVGIAKLAQPILNEEDTGILFRLKLGF